jgi:hypothetical protein
MENPSTPTPESPKETPEGAPSQATAETVHITQCGVQQVQAKQVTVRLGAAQSITGEDITLRQGVAAKIQGDQLHVVQGGAALLVANRTNLTASGAGLVLAKNHVFMDQSAARLALAGGEITLDQSITGAVAAPTVKVENSHTVFLIARQVEGDVTAAFGPRESALFGAVAGLVAGVVILLGRSAKKRRRK